MVDSNSQSMSIPEGSLLRIANNILNLLDYPSELENEEDLFLDDFYIAIVGNLISDRKFDLQPGKDNEEKVESLTQLINLLSDIIEMDLSHISAKGIINDHDRVSAKCLLELIEELIKALINENEKEENEESDSIRVKNRKIEEIEQEEISNSTKVSSFDPSSHDKDSISLKKKRNSFHLERQHYIEELNKKNIKDLDALYFYDKIIMNTEEKNGPLRDNNGDLIPLLDLNFDKRYKQEQDKIKKVFATKVHHNKSHSNSSFIQKAALSFNLK